MKTSRDECPLIPMWAITGAPSREFLRERMKNFWSVGITQLMIYARSGLELEYMSDAWLDRCEWICEDAASLGFTSIWLYDEKNWPSGTCNGEVMRLNPDHAIRALCVAEQRWPICSIPKRWTRSFGSPMNGTKNDWESISET